MEFALKWLNKFRFTVAEPPIVSLDGLYTLLALLVLSMAAVCFHLFRMLFNSPVDFSLDWNLFLSWIPLIVAFFTNYVSKRFGRSHIVIIILSIVWLAFFPNAPYMITDLSHLSDDLNRDLTWHDNIMLFYYAQVSLFNGLISLYWIHRSWIRLFTKRVSWTLLGMSFPLAGLGVYLGRVRRLNSWDIVHNPKLITEFIIGSVSDRTAWLLSFEIGILLAILYAVLWSIIRFRVRINHRLMNKS